MPAVAYLASLGSFPSGLGRYTNHTEKVWINDRRPGPPGVCQLLAVYSNGNLPHQLGTDVEKSLQWEPYNSPHTKPDYKVPMRAGDRQSSRKIALSVPSGVVHKLRSFPASSKKHPERLACQGLEVEKRRVSPIINGSNSVVGQKDREPGGIDKT